MSDIGQICHSFNKMAQSYSDSSFLQNKVARILLDFCDDKFIKNDIRKVLDLGAGSGNIANNIKYNLDVFTALDNALNLLRLHPQSLANITRINLVECDFDSYDFNENYDLVISSSALQWAKNLDNLAKKLADSHISHFAFAIFTNASLCELHEFLGTKSPLKSSEEVLNIMQRYFKIDFKAESFCIKFTLREEFLAYLKKCGLLGGGHLSFRDKKRLRFELPMLEANFEVLFIKGSK